MDAKQLQALANELAKNLKTPEDLSQFDRLLKKLSVEAALNAEFSSFIDSVLHVRDSAVLPNSTSLPVLLYLAGSLPHSIILRSCQ